MSTTTTASHGPGGTAPDRATANARRPLPVRRPPAPARPGRAGRAAGRRAGRREPPGGVLGVGDLLRVDVDTARPSAPARSAPRTRRTARARTRSRGPARSPAGRPRPARTARSTSARARAPGRPPAPSRRGPGLAGPPPRDVDAAPPAGGRLATGSRSPAVRSPAVAPPVMAPPPRARGPAPAGSRAARRVRGRAGR